ncbi:PaaI family thioesterase [Undibacterium sp. RTI2.1]|uniref:PaaI family thioesterase n=1 Tax=unclassified Undibacterium TaxID=2630295 RepID=UPI002AB5CBB6|nr:MULTISPECIES: PaaI family thioesterase [unclassified Undibacterium]MDY7539775.1 PaaI family thioesterase [Undibacterium sp. 5I1]MEB0029439.1 PaaI family thioesterase [Undibacterium sp. RTI2.1]MEB0115942.1 PaaI family thioesterase [Undibacterium sp. RTI2.2]MEB0232440.1 PaaI family thioesterase [Undibacterium sp. 10I3]MEB0256810.1 PaaI family thioesterase [Undibacterium sp. 5I1]
MSDLSNPVLQQWLAKEVEIRARLQLTGVVPLEQMKQFSGLEFLQGILNGELPRPHIGETMDFFPVEGEAGRIVFQGTPGRQHYNPLGSVHGGYFCTLLDSAVGCAVQSMLPKGIGYTTLEIKVNLIRALTDKTGPVRAEGKVIQVGRQVGTAEGRIVDSLGKVYAHATTTCLIFPLP